MPHIGSLGHVGLFVEDVDRSLAFYRDLLGLTLTDADEKAGMYFLSARPDAEHHEFLICRGRTAPRDARLVQQVSFRCDTLADVIGFYHRMKAANVTFDRIVSHGNAIGIYFFDPEGNRNEVYYRVERDVRQPFRKSIDLDQAADAVWADAERLLNDRSAPYQPVTRGPR